MNFSLLLFLTVQEINQRRTELTIFFQVFLEDVAGLGPLRGIIKRNVSVHIL